MNYHRVVLDNIFKLQSLIISLQLSNVSTNVLFDETIIIENPHNIVIIDLLFLCVLTIFFFFWFRYSWVKRMIFQIFYPQVLEYISRQKCFYNHCSVVSVASQLILIVFFFFIFKLLFPLPKNSINLIFFLQF